MKISEVIAFPVGVICANFVGIWFGMAIGLQTCVNQGDSGFKHKLFEESIVCEVKK